MRILFIGLGSIGQRHLRNIQGLISSSEFEFLAYRSSSHQQVIENGDALLSDNLAKHYNLIEYDDLQEALGQAPDVAFICNPSSLHISTAIQSAKAGCHLFIEKPLATEINNLELLEKLLEVKQLISMVGFQFRFHPCIKEISRIFQSKQYGQVISARFNWSTFLPEHHPYEDYSKGYAAREDLGGGVIFSLSHELDIIQYFFGSPSSVYAIKGGKSNLETDVDDTIAALFQCSDGNSSFPVQLHLSFAQGKEQREFTVLLEKGVLYCDLVKQELKIINHQKDIEVYLKFPDFQRNDLFINAIKHFFESCQNQDQTQIPVQEAKKSLLMSLAIHRSLETKLPEIINV